MKELERKLFCTILILQPLLKLYGIGVIGGTFADYTLIIMVIIMLIKQGKNVFKLTGKKNSIEFIPIMLCVILNIFFTWNFSFEIGNQIIYWIRYILYYFVLIYGIKKYYSVETGYKIYEIASIISTIFLIIQYLAYIFMNRIILGQFGPLALTDLKQHKQFYDTYATYNLFRPESFFSEPSHYATFICGFLLICSMRQINKKNILIMAFCSLGILLSGSTTGLCGAVFVWTLFSLRLMKQKNSIVYLLPIIVIAVVVFLFVSQTVSFQIMMQRTFNSRDAIKSRFDWVDSLHILRSPLTWMFGYGSSSDVIELTGWIPGWAIILVQYGIIGIALFMLSYMLLFLHSNKNGKIILVYFMMMGIGTELVADEYVLVLLPFVINKFGNEFGYNTNKIGNSRKMLYKT